MAGEIHRAPHRGSTPRATHPEMAERRGVGSGAAHVCRRAGTPQGGSASPLLANIYLHYVFDLWAQAWRRKHARGDVILVRYADDIVAGFQVKSDAERFWAELIERLGKFGLEARHRRKRDGWGSGPYAAERCKRSGRSEVIADLLQARVT